MGVYSQSFSWFSCLIATCISWLILLSSNKLFMMWLALELKMFAVVPFILKPTFNFLENNSQAITYFVYQAMGTVVFLLGSVMWANEAMLVLGLCIKLGLVPMVVWFPTLVSSLSWDCMFLLTTMKKFPLFYVISQLSCSNLMILLGVLSFSVTMMFIKSGINNIKLCLGWVSVAEGSFLIFLFMGSVKLGLSYLVLYSMMFLVVSMYLGGGGQNSESINGLLVISAMALFLLSGFPPFFSFVYKVQLILLLSLKSFFSGLLLFMMFCFWVQALTYLRLSSGFFLSSKGFIIESSKVLLVSSLLVGNSVLLFLI